MTTAPMLTVVIADDQALTRAGLRLLIDAEPGMRVVAEAATGHEAVALAREHRPDVVLMDIQMPGLDGLAATAAITGDPALATTRILVLTTFDTDEHVVVALRNGASGFLLKDVEAAGLLQAIRTVVAGDSLLAASVTRRIVETWTPAMPGRRDRLGDLTPREVDVLQAVARGMSNAELAAELHISTATAKTHVSRILAKLGARDRVQLVIVGYETGLVTVG